MKAQHINRHITSCLRLLALAAAVCLLVAGCGGGGGGEGGSEPHLTYSGLTTPALITEDNAEALAYSALNAGASSNSFANIAALNEVAPVAVDSDQGFLSDLVMGLDSGMGKIDFLTVPVQDLSASVESGTGSIDGTCGGSASYTIQLNTSTGTFNGSMTFSSYCEEGVTINGNSDFYGVVNMMTEELDSFTLSFNYLTATDGSDSMAMDGEIYMVVSGSTIMSTLDMMIQESGSDRVYKIENYQVDITDGYLYTDISINGRLYDPDYGYVDIETTISFRVYDDEDYPDSGEMLLTGETGSQGQPTWAQITALSNTQCQVIADTDGDGIDDYDSEPMNWSEL